MDCYDCAEVKTFPTLKQAQESAAYTRVYSPFNGFTWSHRDRKNVPVAAPYFVTILKQKGWRKKFDRIPLYDMEPH